MTRIREDYSHTYTHSLTTCTITKQCACVLPSPRADTSPSHTSHNVTLKTLSGWFGLALASVAKYSTTFKWPYRAAIQRGLRPHLMGYHLTHTETHITSQKSMARIREDYSHTYTHSLTTCMITKQCACELPSPRADTRHHHIRLIMLHLKPHLVGSDQLWPPSPNIRPPSGGHTGRPSKEEYSAT